MIRIDLRHLKDDFLGKMANVIDNAKEGEVIVFLFEKVRHELVSQSIELIKKKEIQLMHSLAFNRVDWTIVVKNSKEIECN